MYRECVAFCSPANIEVGIETLEYMPHPKYSCFRQSEWRRFYRREVQIQVYRLSDSYIEREQGVQNICREQCWKDMPTAELRARWEFQSVRNRMLLVGSLYKLSLS